jgi:hypothetical protein
MGAYGVWEHCPITGLQSLQPPGVAAGVDWPFLLLAKAYAGHSDEVLAMVHEKRGDLPRPSQANTDGAWVMLQAVVEGLGGRP